MLSNSVSDLWYKNSVMYAIDVKTYMDSNGDGVGDFLGLTQQLNYLSGLGVTCIWLLPFYGSPNRDNGYDISDYYDIDPRLGTLGDFVEFTRQARERGIRVIIDLVVNHTSDEHPWFRDARKDRSSKYHGYYVWIDQLPSDASPRLVFPGEETSNWEYVEQVGQHYWHAFYKFEPDLDLSNPAVCEEIRKVLGLWLELGISGFRIDAAPFLIERTAVESANVADPHRFLTEMRGFLSARRGDSVFLGEANVEPNELLTYFGDGDQLQLLFNFLSNNYLVLALVRGEAAPLLEGLKMLPSKPDMGQWVNFLRNMDELDLSRLAKAEQDECFAACAPEQTMRIYGRGIRRRLAPMLNGDRARLELAYSLMFTLPGTPMLLYGEEIGMSENLSIEGRGSVRTPMQWSGEQNGGFSTARPEELVRPTVEEEPYGYTSLNVAMQRRDPHSLLNWMERAIRARKECPEFGWGGWRALDTADPSVLALCYEWQGACVIAVHNLSDKDCSVALDQNSEQAPHLLQVYGDQQYDGDQVDPDRIRLNRYGYRWLRASQSA